MNRAEYFRDRRTGKRARGECVHCSNAAPPGSPRCEGCREKERLRRKRLKSDGRCISCTAKALPGRTLCPQHLEDRNARARARYKTAKVKEYYSRYRKARDGRHDVTCARCGKTARRKSAAARLCWGCDRYLKIAASRFGGEVDRAEPVEWNDIEDVLA